MGWFSSSKSAEQKAADKLARQDLATVNRFVNKPSKFLREHIVHSKWPEDGTNPSLSSTNTRFHLVQDDFAEKKFRPGRILGNWRKHEVKSYFLTDNLAAVGDTGRVIGSFDSAKLPMMQTNSDSAPNLGRHPTSQLDVTQVSRNKQIHTADLSGCTLKRHHKSLLHLQPLESGSQLQNALSSPKFGPTHYGKRDDELSHTFVTMKNKRKGVKVYAQRLNASGLPTVTKRYLR